MSKSGRLPKSANPAGFQHLPDLAQTVKAALFTQKVIVALFLLLFTQQAFAQLIEVPIRRFEDYPAEKNTSHPPNASARITAIAPLTLPFFDDFSRPSQLRMGSQPDTAWWMKGGGANVNNNLPINHPTMYVATLDGLKGNGAPYNFSAPLEQGSTDSLTSRPIDLSPYTPASSLYLSFYWEARGLAEQPDLGDSLVLQFKDSIGTGNWRTVWQQTGQIDKNGVIENVTNTRFDSAFVEFKDNAFFHQKFQFRFLAYGRRAGAFDVWHLDYIYLDKARDPASPYPRLKPVPGGEKTPRDQAIRLPVSSFLKRYTAMPIRQYLLNPAQETADSVSTEIKNLITSNVATFSNSIEDTLTKQVLQACNLTDLPCSNGVRIDDYQSQPKSFVPKPLSSSSPIKPMVLKATFNFLFPAEDLLGLNEEIANNNNLSGYTVLDNYYAYDDGTAEAAAGVNQRAGGVAVRFVGNKPDTLLAVRLYFAQYNTNLRGQSFVLQIFDNKDNLPGKVLYQRSDTITYTDALNKFAEYKIRKIRADTVILDAVAVRDTFYVGWQQTTEAVLPVGLDKTLDKNDISKNNIFVNLGTNIQGERDWKPNDEVSGNLMIRPVMGSRPPVVTAIEAEVPGIPSFRIHPNPTGGQLTWNEDIRVSSVQVYDLAGKLLQRQEIRNQPVPLLDLGSLPNGLYLLHFSDGKHTWVRKVVMAR
jgi:hypothetical protein